MKKLLIKTVSLVLLLAFSANTCCYGLATLPASQNPIAKREIKAALQRTQIMYAESADALRLLRANNAECLLLSSGKYLVTREVAEDDLKLLRSIIHEDIEAIMQIMFKEDRKKYQSIKELILKQHPPTEDNELVINLYVNHTIARAFQWLILLNEGLILRDEIPEHDRGLITAIEPIINANRHNYFTGVFWDSSIRGAKIRVALANRTEFYQTANKLVGSRPINKTEAETLIKKVIPPRYHNLIDVEHVQQVIGFGGNVRIVYDKDAQNPRDKIKVYGMAFNPLQALKDPAVFNTMRQIIERRYDVRVLEGKYGLGLAPKTMTFKGKQITAQQLASEMAQFLLDHADENPYDVADNFRSEFLKDGPPPEIKAHFDGYGKIKPKVFDLEVIRDLIPENGTVADIGAGHNVLGQQILQYSDSNGLDVKRMIGTDINDWRDAGQQQDSRLSFVFQESPTNLPLSSNSYDVVIVKWVLHHMTLENQRQFLKDIQRVLRPGGRLVIFEVLGAISDNAEIWKDYQKELNNESSWGPNGPWLEANLKLNKDFKALSDDQQKKLDALEDYFGHNVVMNRVWMPQPYTYQNVGEFQQTMGQLGFVENKSIRRVYGSAPMIRMGPPSIRLVFEKEKTPITLVRGDGGRNKAMVLINEVNAEERSHIKNILGILTYQDRTPNELSEEKEDDIVLLGNERLDTIEEALQLLNNGVGQRIVILGGFGKATIPLIDAAVQNGFKIQISQGTIVNNSNWELAKRAIADGSEQDIIQFAEADIIRQIMEQIVNAWSSDYANVVAKIRDDGLTKVIVTEGRSTETSELLANYKTMLEKEEAFNKKDGHKSIFLQKPHLQLRAKAAFNEIFANELSRHKLTVISHTVSYDNVARDKLSTLRELLGEVWRVFIYSEYGKKYIDLTKIYPGGINGLPQNIWENATFLFNSMQENEKIQLAHELMQLANKEDLSSFGVIPEGNSALKKFVESIQEMAREIKTFPPKIEITTSSTDTLTETSFSTAMTELANISWREFGNRALETATEIASYNKSGQSLILYADDILENALVIDLENTIKNILAKHNVLNGGKIILYARNEANAMILEKMIKHAGSNIGVIMITQGDLHTNGDEIKEIDVLFRTARAKGAKEVLGLIKGPTKQPGELAAFAKDSSLPIVIVGPEKGIYSFAQAIAMVIDAKTNNGATNGWLMLLPPIRALTDDIRRQYEEYQHSLQALVAA